jgi:hypothetical protein
VRDAPPTTGGDIVTAVTAALLKHPAIRSVTLVGSRAAGTPVPLSDWDFLVEVEDFAAISDELPGLVATLEPLAEQWDRLNAEWCYMLLLPGPVKVDLIFDQPHSDEPPWTVDADTLPGIDRHFWDWILWLSSKEQRGERPLVRRELDKMNRHLLHPLGAVGVPGSIPEAIERYRRARRERERQLGTTVSRRLGREVAPVVPAPHGLRPDSGSPAEGR